MNFVPQINQSKIDCEWQDYGAWSECNATCGMGLKVRYRKTRPGNGGGINCVGSSKEVKQCTLVPCKNKQLNRFSIISDLIVKTSNYYPYAEIRRFLYIKALLKQELKSNQRM